MKIQFTKMHGAGNDFVVLDYTKKPFDLTKEQLIFLADRHFGVGADQILVVEKAPSADVDFKYRIFNQDGGEVEQCGNGARCFARFVYDKGLTAKKKIRVQTMKTIIEPELLDDGNVKVLMGSPSFEPASLPFNPEGLESRMFNGQRQWKIDYKDRPVWFFICSMGNPHITIIVDDVDQYPVHEVGSFLETHPAFPNRVNVGFLQIQSKDSGKIRVWERGAGETLACGTGNSAAAAAAMSANLLNSSVTFSNKGGKLGLQWSGTGNPLFLIGPAVKVFDSEVEAPS